MPEIERNIDTMGLSARCSAVVPAHVPVLELGQRMETLHEALCDITQRDPDTAVVLGARACLLLRMTSPPPPKTLSSTPPTVSALWHIGSMPLGDLRASGV